MAFLKHNEPYQEVVFKRGDGNMLPRLECISSTPGLGQDRFEGGGICGYKSLYYKVNAIQLISNM